jgi:hypothetical protein
MIHSTAAGHWLAHEDQKPFASSSEYQIQQSQLLQDQP